MGTGLGGSRAHYVTGHMDHASVQSVDQVPWQLQRGRQNRLFRDNTFENKVKTVRLTESIESLQDSLTCSSEDNLLRNQKGKPWEELRCRETVRVARVGEVGSIGDVGGAAGRLTSVDLAAETFGETARRSGRFSSNGEIRFGLCGRTRRDSVREVGGVEAPCESGTCEYRRVVGQSVLGVEGLCLELDSDVHGAFDDGPDDAPDAGSDIRSHGSAVETRDSSDLGFSSFGKVNVKQTRFSGKPSGWGYVAEDHSSSPSSA